MNSPAQDTKKRDRGVDCFDDKEVAKDSRMEKHDRVLYLCEEVSDCIDRRQNVILTAQKMKKLKRSRELIPALLGK